MGWKKDYRKKMRKQRQMARMSKRQAKKLKKIYKDMSPEEIAELNAIAPEIATGADQVNNAGVDSPAVDSGDPIATMSAYNSEFGDGSGNGLYYDEAGDNWETFEDFGGENFGDEDGGFDADPYVQLVGGVSGIIDQFRQNFEKNKPENWNGEHTENFGKKIKDFISKHRIEVKKKNPGGSHSNKHSDEDEDKNAKTKKVLKIFAAGLIIYFGGKFLKVW